MSTISVTVNGRTYKSDVEPRTLLVQFLRENLYLFPAITLFCVVQVLVSSLAVLALSSLSRSRDSSMKKGKCLSVLSDRTT